MNKNTDGNWVIDGVVLEESSLLLPGEALDLYNSLKTPLSNKEIEDIKKTEYIQKRLDEYPTIEEQLDMIYWDKVNVTNVWKAKIDEVKAKFPKPTGA